MLSAFEEYSHIEVEYLISPRLHFLLQQMITAHVCILHFLREDLFGKLSNLMRLLPSVRVCLPEMFGTLRHAE